MIHEELREVKVNRPAIAKECAKELVIELDFTGEHPKTQVPKPGTWSTRLLQAQVSFILSFGVNSY